MTDDALRSFRDALKRGDVAAALDQFDGVERSIDAQEQRERALRAVARGAIARSSPSDQVNQAATRFVDAAHGAQQERLGFGFDFISFAGENLPTEDMVARVNAVIDAHETVQSRADQLRSLASGVALPPLLGVFGPARRTVPKGSDVSVSTTVENVGTTTVEGVELSVGRYDLDPSPASIDSLDAEETATITLTGTASEAGEFSAVLEASAGETAESHQVSLVVLAKVDYLEAAQTDLDDLQAKVDALDGGSLPKGLTKKLDTADKRIEGIVSDLQDGRGGGRSVDQRIRSVANLVEAFTEQVEGISPRRLSEERAAVLLHDADQVIGALEAAIEAEA